MESFIITLQLVGGLVALTLGADALVRGSSRFALASGVKPVVVGLTLVAFGTSAPELTVSVSAAITGDAGISLGNVIGSNICNIALILGACAMIKPLPISREMFARDIPVMLAASVLLAVLPFVGGPTKQGDTVVFELSRAKACVFLCMFGTWLWLMLRNSKSAEYKPEEPTPAGRKALLLLLSFAGLAGLIGGGYYFVEGSVGLARMLGMPELIIGLTVVAVGTSLPEFATSLIGSLRGQADISVGNIVGSNTFNILLILGVAASIAPLTVEPRILQFDVPVMLAIALLLPLLTWRTRQLGRAAGALFVALYAAYVLNLIFNWI